MIIDTIENLEKYLPEKYRCKIMQWLESVTPEISDGEYEIEGDNVIARVFSYHTKPEKDCRIEAHNRYVDIQSTIQKEEGIQVYRRNALKVEEAYSEEKDVLFFERTEEPIAKLSVKEGMFAMLFPHEAHQPEISYSEECPKIRKFVIKIKEELYE